jgi:ubiquinol-cytochrome c reductase cytochrome b subunit
METAVALLMICVLGLMAHFHPMELGPKANPADTQYVPRPEWYYLPIFQWLKYFKGPYAVFGIVVIPGLTALLVLALPFIDRRSERRPWKRPLAVGSYLIILGVLITFGILSKRDDALDPAVAKQVARQQKDTEAFMQESFEPEPSSSALSAPATVTLDPLAAEGKKFYDGESCDACHGANGIGTDASTKLIGFGTKKSADEIASMLRQPTKEMVEGEMPPVNLSDEQLKALVAYLQSLK